MTEFHKGLIVIIIVMGVCACGKSSVGKSLAERLSWNFLEGDDFHPQENLSKMSAGVALTDEDRWPWLDLMIEEMQGLTHENEHAVLSCSSLKKAYRDHFRESGLEIEFLYLEVKPALVEQRLSRREDHFFAPSLIQSQFDALESPSTMEALCADGAQPVEDIVQMAISVWDLEMM